jgi:hypothetical protein
MLACVCAIADEVNEVRYPEPEFGADYCEQEPEIPNAEPELLETSKTASSILSFDACFGPSFINTTLYPFYKLHNVLLQKPGRIATLDCYD